MKIEEPIRELESGITNTRFARLLNICKRFFGAYRTVGSHHIFKTPWAGDPRINIQREGKNAKPYQVRQVIQALKKLQEAQKKK